MNIPRTEAELLTLIADQVEESVVLDYKRAAALTAAKSDLVKEVTKDVSAFANSAGGAIIYGVAEGSDANKHLPVAITPINRTQFSKERLEHLINNVQPKIEGIEIVPIPLSTGIDHAVYVVVIPASTTAHQCTDKRYYRRFNFEAVMMEDYEIRDVMNRNRFPILHLNLVLSLRYSKKDNFLGSLSGFGQAKNEFFQDFNWTISVKNTGGAVGHYLQGSVDFPCFFLDEHEEGGADLITLRFTNFLRTHYGSGLHVQSTPPEYKRILPGCNLEVLHRVASIEAMELFLRRVSFPWKIFCDSAPPREGVVATDDVLVEMNSECERELSKHSVDLKMLKFGEIVMV